MIAAVVGTAVGSFLAGCWTACVWQWFGRQRLLIEWERDRERLRALSRRVALRARSEDLLL